MASPHFCQSLKGFLETHKILQEVHQGYGSIAQPLTNLLKKDSFHWDDMAQQAFTSLKEAVSHPPVLAHQTFHNLLSSNVMPLVLD